MLWKTPDGHYLVQGALEPIQLYTAIHLPNGEAIREAAPFYQLTPEGAVVRKYFGPIAYSLDDTLGVSDIHVVIGSELHSFHWIAHAWNEPVLDDELLLSGLAPCAPEDLPFDPTPAIAAYEKPHPGYV